MEEIEILYEETKADAMKLIKLEIRVKFSVEKKNKNILDERERKALKFCELSVVSCNLTRKYHRFNTKKRKRN